jgi:excisionase family DNA binding protein
MIFDESTSSKLLRPEQGAKILNISKPYVYKLISTGMLPAIVWAMPGAGPRRNVVRIRWEDLQEFMSKHHKGA